jgi:hypothetical protein
MKMSGRKRAVVIITASSDGTEFRIHCFPPNELFKGVPRRCTVQIWVGKPVISPDAFPVFFPDVFSKVKDSTLK